MIQEIIVYIIIGAVILKVIYSLYKSLITKDKSHCGGCASCKTKSEMKRNVSVK
jgi:7-cyano-7-deazaguanine synthase in queuosine biosynthesis